MKKILFLAMVTMLTVASAQQKEGVITYEQVIKINTDRFPPEVRSMIPPERKSERELLFNENESIYRSVKNQDDINEDVTAGNDRIRFRMRGADENESYTDVKTGKAIEKNEFFGRIFLIEDEESDIEWKITSEMKMVGQYQCMKATYMRDTIPVTAWFTPQIPLSIGPGQYRGLPGMILRVEVNDGQQTITATNLDLRALTEEEVIEVPSKGKKVSREEFREIQREKMEEMREMNGGRGGGGTFIIRN